MTSFAEASRALAAVAERAGSVRGALVEWSTAHPHPVILLVSRRARMGAPLATALEPLRTMPDGSVAARAIDAHGRHGGSLAASMRALADAQEGRQRSAHEALMAGSSSKLSGRLLAALGAVGILLMPSGPMSVPVAAGSLGLAFILAAIGTVWMRRIAPHPPLTDPPAAAIADLTAGLIDAGLYPTVALDLACPEGLAARRLVRLGMSWPAALDRAEDEDLRAMAKILLTTSATGTSPDALRRFARSLRDKQRRECDVATHRAPVLLVLPLTLCFLPAFALVLVGPMIRGLSG